MPEENMPTTPPNPNPGDLNTGNGVDPNAPKPKSSRTKNIIIAVVAVIVVGAVIYLSTNTALFKGQIQLQPGNCFIPEDDIYLINGQYVSKVISVEYEDVAAPTDQPLAEGEEAPVTQVTRQVIRDIPVPQEYVDMCLQGVTVQTGTLEPTGDDTGDAGDTEGDGTETDTSEVVDTEEPVDETESTLNEPEFPEDPEDPDIPEEPVDFEDIEEASSTEETEPVDEEIEESSFDSDTELCINNCVAEEGAEYESACEGACSLTHYFYVDSSVADAEVFRECFDSCMVEVDNPDQQECVDICEISPFFYADYEGDDSGDGDQESGDEGEDEEESVVEESEVNVLSEEEACVQSCENQGGSACDLVCAANPESYQ